jgi:protein-S-isoprenylcysteine O-methyltransferase Ste14
MNIWMAKLVAIASFVAMIVIRTPHGRRSRSIKVVKDYRGPVEIVTLIMAIIGSLLPLVWVVSPAFRFAEYPLYPEPFVAGVAFLVVGLWIFYRSHADLGTNWSVTLQVREQHRLVTNGVYRHIRHPMYLALFLYSIGHALALPNWVAGPSYLVTFGLLFVLRLRTEERMMLEQFGDEYRAYMAKTKRLIPGIW